MMDRLSLRRLQLRIGGVLAGVLVATLASIPGCVSGTMLAAAEGDQPVGDAQAVTLPSDFTPPPGARRVLPLAGLAFSAPSITAGFYSRIESTVGSYAPAQRPDELLFLSADVYSFAPPFGQAQYHYAAPQLAVSFDGHAVALAQTPDGTISGVAGSAYGDDGAHYPGRWVVALPKGAPVELVATEGGFAQSLDLRSGERSGSSPVVLYRSQSGPLALDMRPNLARTLVVTAGGNRVSFPVTLQETALNYFDLASTDATVGLRPDQAYLFVKVSVGVGVDQAGRADWYFDPAIPTQAVAASVDGGSALAPSQGPPSPDPTDTSTPFKGLYGFVVPASVTSVGIIVGPGSDPSVYYEGPEDLSPRAEPVSSSSPASFSSSFPSPAPATLSQPPLEASSSPPASGAGAHAADQPVSLASGSSTRTARHGGSGSGAGVGAAAGAGAVIVILAGVFISRRTRIIEPRAVQATGEDVQPDLAASVERTVDPTGEPVGVPADISMEAAGAVVALAPEVSPLLFPRLRVRVLGILDVEGTVAVIRRRGVVRTLVVLCLNLGRPIATDELRNRLATSEDSEPSASTVRTDLSRLRAALPDGLLPDREAGAGYALRAEDVEVDLFEFNALAHEADTAVGERRLELAERALRLVRGPLLEHGTWYGIDRLVWEVTAEIERFASRSATYALEIDRPEAAGELARRGLLTATGSPGLWKLRLQAARAGSGESVEQLNRQAKIDTGSECSE